MATGFGPHARYAKGPPERALRYRALHWNYLPALSL